MHRYRVEDGKQDEAESRTGERSKYKRVKKGQAATGKRQEERLMLIILGHSLILTGIASHTGGRRWHVPQWANRFLNHQERP